MKYHICSISTGICQSMFPIPQRRFVGHFNVKPLHRQLSLLCMRGQHIRIQDLIGNRSEAMALTTIQRGWLAMKFTNHSCA